MIYQKYWNIGRNEYGLLDGVQMRFLGNKESIVDEIELMLEDKKLISDNMVLFDCFMGTGSVSEHLKSKINIIGNDSLEWCVVYSEGRINKNLCTFRKLGFNPIDFFNSNCETKQGFFYENYTTAGSDRMYFSEYNGGRIDYFRQKIEEWNQQELLSNIEYNFLLACLLESVSLVANVAGVYGAFLKHWDSRALKDIQFVEVNSLNNNDALDASFYNNFVEDIISTVDADILYLDPPYTQNQYGTQYHLLETLIKYDNPSISKVTGSRSTAPMRSNWSKENKAHILLDYVLANTKAKHIVLSYSSDGIMSKQYIESVFKRYGKEETFECREIQYKKYRNWKTKRTNKHFEYLFYIEKKEPKEVVYESPLNYKGSKYKYMNEIKKYFPNKVDKFYDLFGGGFNVGINSPSSEIIYNDINYIVKDIIKSFKETDTYEYLMYIRKIEKNYGLEAGNKENYLKARNYFNSLTKEKDPKFLYTLVLYGFQQQIRFNKNHDFNNPSGNRWFNDNILEKLISFSRILKEHSVKFCSIDFDCFINEIQGNDFVYLDPPYRFTTGSYNDGKRGFNGWSEEEESRLLKLVDELDRKGIRFMFSYVINHKENTNNNILNWLNKNSYKIIGLERQAGRKREEVLIVNYETNI